ncbi:MAG: hypothetical protein L0Y54_19390, partial [Sporichthyaceae bacterium]|nr:hypothetical protein [Sporichthyaceae bacterium]
GDTWTWDGTSWSQLPTTQNPLAGVDLAYDSRRGRVIGVETKWLGTAPYALRLWELGVITAAAATTAGMGCGSVTPSIGTLGVPRVGRAQFAIDVGRAPVNALGALIFAAGPASIPLGSGCSLYIDPTVTVSLPFATSAFGYSSQTIPIPVQVPIGAALYIQGVMLDAGSPIGLALTDRLDLTFGE